LTNKRRFKVGAEIIKGEGVHFRVWAPEKQTIELVLFKDMETQRRNYFFA
jgi:maltooligosyltrehalose trehalohydrolase